MVRGDDKLARAAHIKRHTIGTSNEISLSVLDAARNRLDSGGEVGRDEAPRRSGLLGRGSRAAKGRAPRGFAPPVGLPAGRRAPARPQHGRKGAAERPGMRSSVATGMPVESFTGASGEIARRKSRRRIAAVATVAVVVVFAAVSLSGLGAWWATSHQAQEEGKAQLSAALESLVHADEALIEFDAAYEEAFGKTAVSQAKDARGALGDAGTAPSLLESIRVLTGKPSDEDLRNAHAMLQDVLVQSDLSASSLQDNDDREAANQAFASSSHKSEMATCAEAIRRSAAEALAAADAARQAQDYLAQGEDLYRQAAAALGEADPESVEQSRQRGEQAIGAYENALAAVCTVEQAMPSCSVGPVGDYIQLRLDALRCAQASNQALLDGDDEEAVAQNEEYTKLDEQAAAAAEGLPSSLERLVEQTLASDSADARRSYEQARLQAAASDAFIRDYLGASGK